MNFNTYVINLEKDKENWTTLQSSLHERGVNPIRFDAIYGKEIPDISVYDDILTKKCKYTCPYSVIGIGLSHLLLGKQIYENDPNDHALILEDDVVPEFTNKEQLAEIIANMPQDCDVLALYCDGMCDVSKNNDTYVKKVAPNIRPGGYIGYGSAAAYVMTKRALQSQLDIKLDNHIDLQMYSSDLNIYIYNGHPIFSVPPIGENPSSNSSTFKPRWWDEIVSTFINLKGITLLQLFNYNIFRIPFINITLTSIDISIILFLMWYLILANRTTRT